MPTTVNLQPQRTRDLRLALWIFLAALCARIAYLVFKGPLLTADGSYYYAVARNLNGGRGFTIDYVWHYLAGIPPQLPTPSNEYWMPLSSLFQATALRLAGLTSIVAAAMPGILAGAALAAFVFWLTRELFGSTRAALLAAVMWTVSAHLVALSASPDCFMVAALFTSLALYATYRALATPDKTQATRSALYGAWGLGAGALAGLAYLARSDGVLVAVTFVALWIAAARRGEGKWRPLAVFAAAFVVVAVPWWVRNWLVFGAPLGAPAYKTAFLATYNDIFRLDASSLNLDRYLALSQTVQGLMKVYVVWREVRLLAVMCGLALPFAVWTLLTASPEPGSSPIRSQPRMCAPQLAPWLIYGGLAMVVTALVFPYPALKGTFWHLAPGLCVFIFAAGAAGICDVAQRLWRLNSTPVRSMAAALPAAAVAILVAWYAFTPSQSDVDRSPYRYAAGKIVSLREPVQVAITDDAWSLHQFSGLRCAQVPTDGAGAVLRVADTLGANYVFLRERTLRSIAEVAAIRRCRRFEPLARWGEGSDAIHVYHLMPFAIAERTAKSHNARGLALAAAGSYDQAVRAFEAAASYKPDFAPVIANIALACWQAGRPQEAHLRAAEALALDADNRTAKRILQEAGR